MYSKCGLIKDILYIIYNENKKLYLRTHVEYFKFYNFLLINQNIKKFMIYFNKKLTDFALKLLELDLTNLKQKQINVIKGELLELITEAKALEKFFVSTENYNDIMHKITRENISSFIDVLNNTIKRIECIQDDNLKVLLIQVKELL